MIKLFQILWLAVFISITCFGQEVKDSTQQKIHRLPTATVTEAQDTNTSQKCKLNGTQSLAQELKHLQGVDLLSRGSFGQEVIFRGQSPKRLQVQIDGMRVLSACTDNMDPVISYLNPNSLHTAQVHSSAQSGSQYNGLSGTMYIELDHPSLNTAGLQAEAASYYNSNTNGMVNQGQLVYSSKNWALQVNGSHQDHQNYQAGGGETIAHSHNKKYNLSLHSAGRVSENALLRLDIIYDKLAFAGFPALPMDVSNSSGLITGVGYKNFSKPLGFEVIDIKLYYNRLVHYMDDSERLDVYMHMDMPGWSETMGLNFKAEDKKWGNQLFSVFAEAYTNYRKAEMTMFPPEWADEPNMYMLTWPDARLTAFSLGANHQSKWNKLTWKNSIRTDYEHNIVLSESGAKTWEGFGHIVDEGTAFINPQVKTYVHYHINKKHHLMAGASWGKRSPNTSELYGFYLFNAHDAFDYLGNPDMEQETLLNTEITYKITSKKITQSLSVYSLEYSNYIFGVLTQIDNMTVRARGTKEYQNLDKATFYGFTANTKYQVNKPWCLFNDISYNRGYIPTEFDLPLIPPLQGKAGLKLQTKKWLWQVDTEWANAQNRYNEELGDQYTPGYAVINSSFNYKVKWSTATLNLYATGQNLLDKNFRRHLNWGGIPNMGRNLILGVKINWQEKI